MGQYDGKNMEPQVLPCIRQGGSAEAQGSTNREGIAAADAPPLLLLLLVEIAMSQHVTGLEDG